MIWHTIQRDARHGDWLLYEHQEAPYGNYRRFVRCVESEDLHLLLAEYPEAEVIQ